MTWNKPITTGQSPRCRAGHSCAAYGTKLYIFGGGDGNLYLNDLHILDTGYYFTLHNFFFFCNFFFNFYYMKWGKIQKKFVTKRN